MLEYQVLPVLEYICQVFHFALLIRCHKRVLCQKRVLAIIYPSVDIADSLCHSEILKLSDRRLEVCNKLFNDIVITPTNNRGNLPPARHTPRYNLRLPRVFVPPRAKTCRSVNTFVPSLVGVRNQS